MDEILKVNVQLKPIRQCFPVALFTVFFKMLMFFSLQAGPVIWGLNTVVSVKSIHVREW